MLAWTWSRANALSALVVSVASLMACGGNGPPSFVIDGSTVDASDGGVPSDASTDASDASMDASDGSILGDGGVVTCVAGSASTLFTTLHMPGGRVPFTAEANVSGLFVAALTQQPADFPAYERTAGFFSQTGVVSAPAKLSVQVTTQSTRIAIAQSGDGFLTVFDESTGGAKDLWTRSATSAGELVGTQIAQLTDTMGVNESLADFRRTATGFAGVWQLAGTGPVTAFFDTSAVLVGSTHPASGVTGTTTLTRIFSTGSTTYLAYFGMDSLVHAVELDGTGNAIAPVKDVTLVAGSGTFDIASASGGAGIVYEAPGGSGPVVRFRAISSVGGGANAEHRLHTIDEDGSGPTIAPLAGGYLVLFRFVPTVGNATLRTLFLSTGGEVLGEVDLVESIGAAANHAIRVSPDGEIYVVYQEPTTIDVSGTPTAGAAIRALRMVCE